MNFILSQNTKRRHSHGHKALGSQRKKILKISLLLLFFSFTDLYVSAQDNPPMNDGTGIKTVFSSEKSSVGIYGGIVGRYSDIGTAPGAIIGARVCFIAGHSLAIGLAGNGIFSEKVYDANLTQDCYFSGGYGGLLIEPIILAKHPIHISIPILMGAGGISYEEKSGSNALGLISSGSNTIDTRSFFILEPGVEVEINVLKFFRLAVGGYYRYTSNTSLRYDNNMGLIAKSGFLKGFSTGVTLKFGKF
jgi:hypothetical protein